MSMADASVKQRQAAQPAAKLVVFTCFFLSGFASLLYQVLWTRLAFAHFGVIIEVLSLTVSTFMLGLGLGSIYGGRWVQGLSQRFGVSPLLLYAAVEGFIGLGAFAVPAIYDAGGHWLFATGAMSGVTFLLVSGVFIVLALLPWCLAMGATVPLMMGFVRQIRADQHDGFSLLYLGNVLGAASGAVLTALVLIEIFGIYGAGMFGAAANLSIAALACATALKHPAAAAAPETAACAAEGTTKPWLAPVLFITGFSSIGMEVCWSRDFTFLLQTTTYAFAVILFVYLLATFAGSRMYLDAKAKGRALSFEALSFWLFPAALLPLFTTTPRHLIGPAAALVSIAPLCALLGYTTPGLIDRFGQGDPRQTGRLYAMNIAGGVLGPLVAGYFLLPLAGIRWSIILLALPLAAAAFAARGKPIQKQLKACMLMAVPLVAVILLARTYDEMGAFKGPMAVKRDYAASAVAKGSGRDVSLLVNGVPITILLTVTKVMADLPMAEHGNAHRVLDICFGMGTTFRTLALWNDDVTAVDLSPAVIHSFAYFHDDAAAILARPNVHEVADDGRRFLERTGEMFDVITIDPPPPVQASGSSLLYSAQFYDVVKKHLAPGGVLAQWVPGADGLTTESITQTVANAFPYVRVFKEDGGGLHYLASMTPLPVIDTATFIARMPPATRDDLIAWEPGTTLDQFVSHMLANEIPLAEALPPAGSRITPITDDRPFNEYYLLREAGLF